MLGFAICRQASDYLKPGYLRGYQCKICTKPLQVGPVARPGVDRGEILPLCNECGFAMKRRLEDAGAPVNVVFTPEALARFRELAEALANQN